ncbi:MAG: LicD family protein [Bacteroidota bacterium]
MLSIAEVQAELFRLLLIVDELCKQHDVSYWLDGGSLLGARRNGEFIPWDDDIDICFPVSEYQKIRPHLKALCDQSEELLLYNDYRPSPHWSEYFGSLRILKNGLLPVKLDIVLVKVLPNEDAAIQTDKNWVENAWYYGSGKRADLGELTATNSIAAKQAFMQEFLEEYLYQQPTPSPGFVYNYAVNDVLVSRSRPYYTHEQLFPLTTIQLLGKPFPVPAKVDEYLTILYGENFIQPPAAHLQRPEESVNSSNTLPKKRIESWLRWFYQRQQLYFLHRSVSNPLLRPLLKFPSFLRLSAKAIARGDFLFIYRYLKFAYLKWRH